MVDDDGRIVRRHDLEAEDDEMALKHARQYVDGHDVELWQRARVVAKLTSKPR
jgi:hypothetical protein